jgi:hypothetical protein
LRQLDRPNGASAAEVTIECLLDSPLPDELRQLRYDLRPAGEGERIVAGTIVERLTLTSCGIFEALTEGSTKAARRGPEARRHLQGAAVQFS